MKDTSVIVYTMKGCPHCVDFKEMLNESKIEYFDRDIDEFEEEYNLFVEITQNDYVPAILIIEGDNEDHKSYLYAPERDYDELTEAVQIIKKHI
jgi:glutaredoxin